MRWRNVGLIFRREVIDQLRDRRTLFMIAVLPLLLYPALGIGMVQLTVLFTEQPRTVVVLGTAHLPESPALLEQGRFAARWFRNQDDATKLEVITDSGDSTGGDAAEGDAAENVDAAGPSQSRGAGDESPAALSRQQRLLIQAAGLRDLLEQRDALERKLTADGLTADEIDRHPKLLALNDEMSTRFNSGAIQVLMIVPTGFAESLELLKQRVRDRNSGAELQDYARPQILQNTASEKSLIASNRVQAVLNDWEREILKQTLAEVGLPSNLPQPVKPITVDLAEQAQLSANVWSKLFPALLVIMSLTGAFYPAIDLGAGEKERGTMETLLICPATRTEIVLGKFLTVMLFSASTALLNLGSLGFTGKYMVSLAGSGPMSKLVDLALPPMSVLVWVLVMLAPLSALFSALCLAFATFARSSKEGQYYLTPLLMVTMGLTVFCLSPAVEIQPFYSVMPVMGPALLLKGLLQPATSSEMTPYILPVLVTSLGYSLLALWWAIDQFGGEDVLFREAERFDLRLWLRHLLRDKDPTPSFSEAMFCFVTIMLLQFGAMRFFQGPLQRATESERGLLMLQLLIIQQLVIIATPPLFMGVMLTSSVRETFRLRWPGWTALPLAAVLACMLHPLSLEFGASIAWFFPPLPPHIGELLKTISSDEISFGLTLLAFAVAPAVCEEIAFRGFLLSGYLHGGRERLAIVLSALTFGIIHLIPQQVLNASLLGLVIGFIAVRTRSLFPGIVFHLVYNGLELVRSRYGNLTPTSTGWDWLFWFDNDGSLRYQPLLLVLCATVAGGLLWHFARRRPARSMDLPPEGDAENPHEAPSTTAPAPTSAQV